MIKIDVRPYKCLDIGICGILLVALQSLASSPAYAVGWDCSNGTWCCFKYNSGVEWCVEDHRVVQHNQDNAFDAKVSHSEDGTGEENVLANCVDRTLEFMDGDDPKGAPDDDSVVDEICKIGHDWSKICGDPPPSCTETCVVQGCKCVNGECR